ncbi:hypothetical protein D3C85_1612510 [compost metagenome]
MSYQSAFLNARPELQKMLLGLNQEDPNVQELIRILRGVDYELSQAARVFIDRFEWHVEPGGHGLKPGSGLCRTDKGSLVRYTDHLNALAIAITEQTK